MTDTNSRRQLVGMVAIALLTVGGAYALFYLVREDGRTGEGGVWGTTNNGSFVVPATSAAALELIDSTGRPMDGWKNWWLWVVAPDGCLRVCEAALQQLRQLHVLLNKDAGRVQRALLTRPDRAPAVLAEYPRLVHLSGSLAELSEGIYIVDPNGNLVLFYPLSEAGKSVLDDLKRLLKLSRIG